MRRFAISVACSMVLVLSSTVYARSQTARSQAVHSQTAGSQSTDLLETGSSRSGVRRTGTHTTGPVQGALVLAGGGIRGTDIYNAFVELAGGKEAKIVVIPTAGGEAAYDSSCACANPFRTAGITDLTVLHTYDRKTAESESFIAPLQDADGVWFSGGRQWRLVDAYGGTRTEEAVRAVLDRGGVVGGSSAGATIQASYLARGDTRTNTVMMGDHTEGFGYLGNAAVDQHVLRRNRHYDLIEIVSAHPEILGIGLDEDTALVVRGDSATVIGSSYVLIYDHGTRLDSGAPFYFLAPGDRFDLRTRRPVSVGDTRGLKARFRAEEWPH